MKLIKLNAIDSTNEYIKKIKTFVPDKLFCVYTYNQKQGKGQRANIWHSEPNKNLCISFCLKPTQKNSKFTSFKLNMLVSIILLEFFKKLKIPNLRIKWPNDILSADKKISGILIESNIKSNKINDYIIGLGLNINQEKFNNLLNANSIKNITGINYDLNEIANSLIKNFEDFYEKLIKYSAEEIKIKYLKNLYGLTSPIEFFHNEEKLSGKITDIISDHKIKLIIDDKEKVFDSAEIKLIF